jgi:hypothetical protein
VYNGIRQSELGIFMGRTYWIAWCALVLAIGQARSQTPFPAAKPRPVISPYLNLLRRGNSPAFNYLTLVRPELNIRNAIDQVEQQVQQGGAAQGASQDVGPDTGHRASYMTHGKYFGTMQRGGSSATGPRTSAPQAGSGAAPTSRGRR